MGMYFFGLASSVFSKEHVGRYGMGLVYVVRFTYIRRTAQAHTQAHIYTSASSHRPSQFQVNVSQFLFSQIYAISIYL